MGEAILLIVFAAFMGGCCVVERRAESQPRGRYVERREWWCVDCRTIVALDKHLRCGRCGSESVTQ